MDDGGSPSRARVAPAARSSLAVFAARTSVDLVVSATDLTACGVRYLRVSTDGDMSVVAAVVASMSAPLLYVPMRDPRGHLLVDGSVLDNFPLLCWPAHEQLAVRLMYNVVPTMEGLGGYVCQLAALVVLTTEVATWAAMPSAHKARAC